MLPEASMILGGKPSEMGEAVSRSDLRYRNAAVAQILARSHQTEPPPIPKRGSTKECTEMLVQGPDVHCDLPAEAAAHVVDGTLYVIGSRSAGCALATIVLISHWLRSGSSVAVLAWPRSAKPSSFMLLNRAVFG
jgi:hypothetical protein